MWSTHYVEFRRLLGKLRANPNNELLFFVLLSMLLKTVCYFCLKLQKVSGNHVKNSDIMCTLPVLYQRAFFALMLDYRMIKKVGEID